MHEITAESRVRTYDRKQCTLLAENESTTENTVDLATLREIIRHNVTKLTLANQTAFPVNATVQPVILIQD